MESAGSPVARDAPPPSNVGPAEAARARAAQRSPARRGLRVASAQHRGRAAAPEWLDRETPTPAHTAASRTTAHADDRAQRDLDGGLQGSVPPRERPVLLPAHGAGRLQERDCPEHARGGVPSGLGDHGRLGRGPECAQHIEFCIQRGGPKRHAAIVSDSLLPSRPSLFRPDERSGRRVSFPARRTGT